jgi:hypothetical protein
MTVDFALATKPDVAHLSHPVSVEPTVIEPTVIEPIALVSSQRITAVLAEQATELFLLNYDVDLVAIFDFNGFLLHLNAAGRQQLGIDLHENLSLFQVRCFSPLTQDMWDEIFRALVDCGRWSGIDQLQYGQQAPITAKMTILGHPLPDGTIDCFSLVARAVA